MSVVLLNVIAQYPEDVETLVKGFYTLTNKYVGLLLVSDRCADLGLMNIHNNLIDQLYIDKSFILIKKALVVNNITTIIDEVNARELAANIGRAAQINSYHAGNKSLILKAIADKAAELD